MDFGPEAIFDLNAQRLEWYDYWLNGSANGALDTPPVSAFLMGANRWLDLDSWPPSGMTPTALLPPGERRLAPGGRLSFKAPDAAGPDSFTYDPQEPVPSLVVYPQLGPTDHRPVEHRVLAYTSDVLQADLAVAGPVTAVLHASSSALDTDWVVRLCDVWPDGRSLSVCDGILRARYRNSLEQPSLLTPDDVYQFQVDLWSTAQVFKAGHRIRVHVTSSDFPRYDRQPEHRRAVRHGDGLGCADQHRLSRCRAAIACVAAHREWAEPVRGCAREVSHRLTATIGGEFGALARRLWHWRPWLECDPAARGDSVQCTHPGEATYAMLETTIAGSLPKPTWLAEPETLWAPWRLPPDSLTEGQRDAVLVALKEQESAGIDIVTDGEQSRQHFVHGFLERIEGVDFSKKVRMGIRAGRYEAQVPVVTGPVRRPAPIHLEEVRWARAHTNRKLKFTLPGPMTIVDTLADEHYHDRERLAMEFAAILNEEARELAAAGVDVLQLDEPAFNVYLDQVAEWGIEALHRAIAGLTSKTAVHICYGYGIQANIDWKRTLGSEWRQYERTFPLLANSHLDQVSLECAGSRVPLGLLSLLQGKDVLLGCIDVANRHIETPAEVAETVERALEFVPAERLYPCTNCGMVPLPREVAIGKLRALTAGARLVSGRVRSP